MTFLERLHNEVLVADGAMGTLLYADGHHFCYEQLNVEKPTVIQSVHEQYIAAGADVIQTNTYSANSFKLARYGLDHRVREFNEAGLTIAKQAAAAGGQYVLGTIGGLRTIGVNEVSVNDVLGIIQQQVEPLLNGDPDGLLLETYYDFDELCAVVEHLRKITDIPIVAQVSMHEPGVLQNGLQLNDALHQLETLGADVVGVNCRLGPYHTIQAFEGVELPKKAFLSAYPNASLLDVEDGRIVYVSETDYYGRAASMLQSEGVRLIGGCCGTTPAHIKAVKTKLTDAIPVTSKNPILHKPIAIRDPLPHRYEPLHKKVKRERTILVELDTPRHLETDDYLEGARQLKAAGADAVTMADNSLASPRISNLAMASIVKHQDDVRPLVHVTCRDHNLIGLQSHLMGLDALGINDILAVTGDPTKIGDFPGATSVYDVSSMELFQLIKQLNKGLSFSGKPLRKKANFSVAGAFNPHVRLMERAVKRLEKKIECGADYFITQPVYTKEKIIEIYEATRHLDTPIFIGIMPLTTSRNAEFLHHEVPGIKLSDDVLKQMTECGEDRKAASAKGIQIAKDLIDTAAELFNGIYVITPFLRYDMSIELIHYIKHIDAAMEREVHHATITH